MRKIRIGIPKGRLLTETIIYLESLGILIDKNLLNSRKLVFDSCDGQYQLILMKSVDIINYVEKNIIDLGIVGRDLLLENNTEAISVENLEFGKCQLCLAAMPGMTLSDIKTIATKYPNFTKSYTKKHLNSDIQVVCLQGSLEIAPSIQIADAIIDLVETGVTLKENNLLLLRVLENITAHLISNKNFVEKNQILIHRIKCLSGLNESNTIRQR